MKIKSLILLFGIIISGLSLKASGEYKVNTLDVYQEEGKYGEDSATCVMNLSLYREFYKQWKNSGFKNEAIDNAIKPWRWVFLNCPKASQNIYIDGANILEYMIKKEKDKTRKNALIDTLMMMYDQRIKYFNKKGYVLGRKGVDLYKLRPSDYARAYEIMKESVELEGNEASGPVLIYYFRAADKMIKNNELDKTKIVDIYDQLSEIIDFNIKASKPGSKKHVNWENISGNIELSFEPYATCDDLIGLYSEKFKSNPEDQDLLKKITKILDKKNCTDSDLFFNATMNLHELEPNAKSAYLMGKMSIKKENFSEAAGYLKEAVDGLEDKDDKADAYYLLANVYYQLNNFSAARSYAYKTLEVRPNDGNPYILIGDLYAASADRCGNDPVSSKAAYWAAVDKYQKARNVDSSVSGVAGKRIASYSAYYPATEDLFFRDLKPGDSYKVECWINETTTVRASD